MPATGLCSTNGYADPSGMLTCQFEHVGTSGQAAVQRSVSVTRALADSLCPQVLGFAQLLLPH